MHNQRKTEIGGYGIRALRSGHRQVRRLKHLYEPSYHGFRVWPSSWLLMDFVQKLGMSKRMRLMEVGCGWGLAGIYCAKIHDAIVTCADIDAQVFPYAKLHADINKVEVQMLQKGFDGLREENLKDIDVVIGADICFWDDLIPSLKSLILRALGADTQLVLIADPGRTTFEKMGSYFVENQQGEISNRAITDPYLIRGRVLRIGSLDRSISSATK